MATYKTGACVGQCAVKANLSCHCTSRNPDPIHPKRVHGLTSCCSCTREIGLCDSDNTYPNKMTLLVHRSINSSLLRSSQIPDPQFTTYLSGMLHCGWHGHTSMTSHGMLQCQLLDELHTLSQLLETAQSPTAHITKCHRRRDSYEIALLS